jgi:prevent-host-death family protein
MVATGSYHGAMQIGIKDAKNQLTELLRKVEAGESVTITRDGTPVVDLVKHAPKRKGLNWQAVREYKKLNGIGPIVDFIPSDFDEPMTDAFLLGEAEDVEEK